MTVVPRMMSSMNIRPANGGMYAVHLNISFAQELDQVADLDHETGNMTSDPHIPSPWPIVCAHKMLVKQMNESI